MLNDENQINVEPFGSTKNQASGHETPLGPSSALKGSNQAQVYKQPPTISKKEKRQDSSSEKQNDENKPTDRSTGRLNYPAKTLLNKGKGTTRSGKVIAGNGFLPPQQLKPTRHESENLGTITTKKSHHNRSPQTEMDMEPTYKEDLINSSKLQFPNTPDNLYRNSLSEEMRQTSKKVLKKLSRELMSLHGIEKSKSQNMALALEGKILASIFTDSRLNADETLIAEAYKSRVVELIKNLKVNWSNKGQNW
jgi:hypothetical protein